ncbi:MAG: LPS export ABC transporter periplasmic protein LptC [Deltaproteobacteria bacterium]|nr:LPS export ABC transporter periplasmic protein LptC [Deltaproteobacteria bacterium]
MKGFLKKQWPLLGLVIVLFLVSFHLIRSGKEIIKKPILNKIASQGVNLKDIHYVHDDQDEGVRWVLDAAEVEFSKDRDNIFFRNFVLRMEPENRPWFKLEGEKGNYSRKSGEIELRGNLKGCSENGYSLTGEHALVNDKESCLRTSEFVHITGPFFSVQGMGLFLDFKKEKLKMLSSVTATLLDTERLIW